MTVILSQSVKNCQLKFLKILMRYNAEYKEQARENLLSASGQHAKQNGFNASGLSDLAAAAGVTTGIFVQALQGQVGFVHHIIEAD